MVACRLIVEDDDGHRTVAVLEWDQCDIGRADGNDIRLTDRNVSRWHARLSYDGATFVVEDLQSSQGTYVNGSPLVLPVALESGNVVQIGDYMLRFEIDHRTSLLSPHRVPLAASRVDDRA